MAGQGLALRDAAERQGWDLGIVAEPGVSGKNLTSGPKVTQAPARLSRSDAVSGCRSGRGRAEDLQRQLVGILERQPGAVSSVLDTAVLHAQRVQRRRPLNRA